MRSIGDDRGQSVQVGAVLLFGIIIVFLAIWQAQVVPAENADVEFQHSLDAQEDMQQLRSEIRSVAGSGASRSTTIELGTRYPTRVAFVNPPPATGSLSTTEGTVSIENVSAEETNGFWNGTTRNYTTNTIAYEPSYSEYRNPPRTVYEHGLLYNEFDREETQLAESPQQLIATSGRTTTIDLVALRGSIDADGVERESIDLYPNSASTQTVRVTPNAEGEPITITIPTRNQAIWNERLSEVEGTAIERVTNVSDSAVEIQLNATDDAGELRSYRLRMAEVGLEEEGNQEPAYIVPVGSNNVNSGEELTAEVRDRYNNPIEGVDVSVDTPSAVSGSGNETTDSSGRVRFAVVDDPSVETIELEITDPETCVGDACTITYDITEASSGSGNQSLDYEFDLAWNESDPLQIETSQPSEAVEAMIETRSDGEPIEDLLVNFGVNDSSVVSIDSASETSDAQGRAETTLSVNSAGDAVLFATAPGSNTDRLNVTVGEPAFFDVSIQDTNSPVSEGETLTVNVSVENTGDFEDAQTIELLDFNGNVVDSQAVTLDGGETTTLTLNWNTSSGDAGTDDITVQSEDDQATQPVTVEETDSQVLSPVEVIDSGDRLVFRIENTGNSQVTIEKFEVVVGGGNRWIDNGSDPELKIQGSDTEGFANRNTGDRYSADGTRYDLVSDSDEGQYAILEADDKEVDIDFRTFVNNGGNSRNLGELEITDTETDADVTVVLVLSDGSEQVFYFQQV